MALPGCTKHLNLGELIQQDVVKSCPILQLQSLDTTEQIVIHYNNAGDPVDMLYVKGAPDLDMQDYHFRYDRFNRLTDFLMNPSITTVAFEWHTYTYPARNVVVDSVYFENDPAPITAPRPNSDSYAGMTEHFLDNEGRIIEDQGFQGTNYFQYDAWGNLVRNIPFPYDNKFNPYLTNNVWRFVYEDYSVNNYLFSAPGGPFAITKYDAIGLPEIYQGGYGLGLFNYEFYPGMQIVYGCDGGQKGL